MLLGLVSSVPASLNRYIDTIDMRGRDAFGAYYEVHKDGHVVKEFEKNKFVKKIRNIDSNVIMCVGRAIPATERYTHKSVYKDTQPFVKGDWVVTHNGLLHNDVYLEKLYSLKRNTKVDSAIIVELLDHFTQSGYTPQESVHKVLDEIKGSFALTIYNTRTKMLVLVTNFMPLYYVHKDNTIFWSSLPYKEISTALDPYSGILFEYSRGADIYIAKPFTLKTELDANKVGVICSGGMDSVTALRMYQVLGYDTTLIHFSYGQAAQMVEDYVTTQIANRYGVRKVKLDVRDLFRHFTSVLLSAKQIPNKDARLLDAEGTYSYVPARNLIFAAIGLGVCEELGLGRIVISGNLDDGGGYPDNNYPFFKYLDYISALSLNQNHKVRFEAPFVHLTKKEILEIAFTTGTPLHLTASCYYPELTADGNIIYCGMCGCDKLRVESFKALDYIDPVKYKAPQRWGRRKSLWKHEQWVERMNNINLRLLREDIPYHTYLDIM